MYALYFKFISPKPLACARNFRTIHSNNFDASKYFEFEQDTNIHFQLSANRCKPTVYLLKANQWLFYIIVLLTSKNRKSIQKF